MRRLALLLVSVAAALAPAAAWATCAQPAVSGTVHYFCDCQTGADANCVAGSDAAAGTSAATAWKSWTKFQSTFVAASPGDQMLWCKGGSSTWHTFNTSFVNASCLAANRCVVGSYTPTWASASGNRPYFAANGDTNGPADFEDGGNADHEEGYAWYGMEFDGGGTAVDGFFFYNDIDDVLLCNLYLHGFAQASNLEGSNSPNAGSDAKNSRIVIDSCTITGNSAQGALGGGDGYQILNTHFQNNGFGLGTFDHNIYLNCSGGPFDSMLVQGNDLYQSSMQSGHCDAVSLVAHGLITNLTIKGNTIKEDIGATNSTCYGIAVIGGYGGVTESFTGVLISGNTVVNPGGAPIAVNSCSTCTIENNVVVSGAGTPGNNITVATRQESGDQLSGSVSIRNNGIYTNSGYLIEVDEGTSHKIYNNHGTTTATGTVNFLDIEAGSSAVTSDYNKFYAPSASTVRWDNFSGDSLATWQGLGKDAHSSVGNPGIMNAVFTTSYDGRASSGSSAIVDTGNTANGSTLDILGLGVSGTSRDIGPYEFQVTVSGGKGSFGVFGGF